MGLNDVMHDSHFLRLLSAVSVGNATLSIGDLWLDFGDIVLVLSMGFSEKWNF